MVLVSCASLVWRFKLLQRTRTDRQTDRQTDTLLKELSWHSELCKCVQKHCDPITNCQQVLVITWRVAKNLQLDGAAWRWGQQTPKSVTGS